jgi:hypothetical protein
MSFNNEEVNLALLTRTLEQRGIIVEVLYDEFGRPCSIKLQPAGSANVFIINLGRARGSSIQCTVSSIVTQKVSA